jgi:hypothetical protein
MTRAMPLWLLVGLQGVVSAASLVVEIVAGRMLAPHVGMSLYTWTAVIAVVLAGFSVGHWWGGRLAGKPAASALAWTGGALLAAAVTTSGAVFVLPAVAGPVLPALPIPSGPSRHSPHLRSSCPPSSPGSLPRCWPRSR